MAKSLEQLVIAARPGEPKALDLDSLTDRGMELALIALAAMVGAALIASLVQVLHLSWSMSLLGLPAALVTFAFSPAVGSAAGGAFALRVPRLATPRELSPPRRHGSCRGRGVRL